MLYNIFLLLVSSFFFLTINTAAGQEKKDKTRSKESSRYLNKRCGNTYLIINNVNRTGLYDKYHISRELSLVILHSLY